MTMTDCHITNMLIPLCKITFSGRPQTKNVATEEHLERSPEKRTAGFRHSWRKMDTMEDKA